MDVPPFVPIFFTPICLFSLPHPIWSPIILTPSLSFSPIILIPLPFNVPCYCHPFSHYLLLPSPQSPYCQGCAVRKTEGSPVLKTCKIQGTQHVISMKKVRFFSSPRAKVRRYRPLGAARVQPCQSSVILTHFHHCLLGCFPFIRTDQPAHSHHNENFT